MKMRPRVLVENKNNVKDERCAIGRSVQLLQDIIRRRANEKRANDVKDLA